MKITHICLAGPMTDYWTYQENLLVKYHKKMGNEVSVITSRWVYDQNNSLYKFPETNYSLDDGTKIIRLEIKNKNDGLSNRFKRYESLYEIIEVEKPDVLFVHGCQFLDVKTIVKYAKKHSGVRIFVDNHADFSNSASNYVSRKILHGVIWKYYAKCIEPYTEKFFGVMPARVDFLSEIYKVPKEKVELLVMGADDEQVEWVSRPEVRKKVRQKYHIAEDDFLIMTGGKIDKAKWQTLLLMEAVQAIEHKKVRLIVFGSVDQELKEQIEVLTDGTKVQYVGWIKASDSYAMFASADLVVFPGRHSVFWEQVVGQGIPMIVKHWNGTTHVDCGGNVKFLYKDQTEEIKSCIENILEADTYKEMKTVAEKAKSLFLYSGIAIQSIR